MARPTPVDADADALREDVRALYGAVATRPDADYRFHTGRALAMRLGYHDDTVRSMPDAAIESFSGVGNPFSLRPLAPGEHVVDIGSGGGFDCFLAARQVGPEGHVVGIDMTEEMLEKSRRTGARMGLDNVEFRAGLIEDIPVGDGWADTVISNGAINLCSDKKQVFSEIWRVLRPGGHLQFADIAHGRPLPEEAIGDIDLWGA